MSIAKWEGKEKNPSNLFSIENGNTDEKIMFPNQRRKVEKRKTGALFM